MRVGWVPVRDSRATGSARLRTFEPIRILRERGVDARLYDDRLQRSFDAVVFQKAYDAESIATAERLREAGKPVIFDLCDNHWYRVEATPEHQDRVQRLDHMISTASLVTTSTPELAALVPADAFVVDDALDPVAATSLALVARALPVRAPGQLLWFGNPGTTDPRYGLVDLLDLVPTLNEVARQHPIALTVISDVRSPILSQISKAAAFPIRTRAWRYLTFGALASRHQVCLLPAQSNPFTLAKTCNRAVTALRCELAVIASDLPAYRRIEDTLSIESWGTNLARHIDDPEGARALARSGRAAVEERFSDEEVAKQWQRAIERATNL